MVYNIVVIDVFKKCVCFSSLIALFKYISCEYTYIYILIYLLIHHVVLYFQECSNAQKLIHTFTSVWMTVSKPLCTILPYKIISLFRKSCHMWNLERSNEFCLSSRHCYHYYHYIYYMTISSESMTRWKKLILLKKTKLYLRLFIYVFLDRISENPSIRILQRRIDQEASLTRVSGKQK